MAHYSSTTQKKTIATPPAWLGVGASVGRLVNQWSFRDDLIVFLGDETQSGAPALFNPISSEIEVNIKKAFGDFVKASEVGDFTKRMTHLEYPVAAGAIFHESLHARFSRWDLEQAHAELVVRGRAKDFNVLHLLEEGRIESLGVSVAPENRVLLRSCAMEIVLADITEQIEKMSSLRSAASLCALTLARVDAGVLDDEDVAPMRDIVNSMLGAEVVEQLRSVWIRFQAHSDHNSFLALLDLAKEWNDILDGIEPSGDDEGGSEGEGTEGESGEGEGETLDPETLGKLRKAVQEMAESIQIDNQDEISDAMQSEEWREIRESRESQAKEQNENRKEAEKVFAKNSGGSTGKSGSQLLETRKPDSTERAAAVRIAQALEKAKYRERSETEVSSVVPPGRLRSRAIVQSAALKSKGVHTPTEVWRQTKRKHTDDPTLSVGVMVDISGSMSSAMEPMATTAWVMSEAVRRVQGKCAMVYYGEDVFATLKPGQHLTDVKVYSAPDGTEEFSKAFKALDGSMNLVYGSGARLLVIVSDGQYRTDQHKLASELLTKADRNGVAILWVTFDHASTPQGILRGTDGKVVAVRRGDSIADLIGRAATDAIGAVGKRNA